MLLTSSLLRSPSVPVHELNGLVQVNCPVQYGSRPRSGATPLLAGPSRPHVGGPRPEAWSNAMHVTCTPPQTSPAHDRGPVPRTSAALALLSFAMLIVSLDQYIVVVALPDIGRELG